MAASSTSPRGFRRRWTRQASFASVALAMWHRSVCTALEIVETVVDRDGDVLVVEDILEGFGIVPVSVEFSSVSEHMFIGFKAGAVRIYPDGGATEQAAEFDFCVDMEEEVRVWRTVRYEYTSTTVQ